MSVARTALTGLAAAATMLVGACGSVEAASAAGVTHDDLVSDLAAQLTRSSALSYTATYQLAGGEQASITQAQHPTRVAYAYPGGRLLRTPTATTRCQGAGSALACDRTLPDPADARSTGALTTPDTILAMLNVAAVDPHAVSTQHDTTIAGRHATCLTLAGVSGTPAANFGVCVTSEGALGSFTATLDGTPADLALTAYSEKPDLPLLTLPPAAKVTDKRR